MPGAVKRWSRVFAQPLPSPVRIVDIALGDNDIEIQRNLLQEMLERHPEIDVVAGTAIAAEAAMGEEGVT